MKRFIMALVLSLMLVTYVKAEPLPLVPMEEAVSATTVQATTEKTTAKTTEKTTAKTEKKTEEKGSDNEKTSTAETELTEGEKKGNIILDTEEDAAAAANTKGNTEIISAVEKSNAEWFTLEQKSDGVIQALGERLAGTADYREKQKLGQAISRGRQRVTEKGSAAPDDIRAAMDALLKSDIKYRRYL